MKMSQIVENGGTQPSSSPEIVRTIANVAAAGEIAIRKAANSAGGRALSAAVRAYPLWSIFIATSVGFLLAGRRQARPVPPAPPIAGKKSAPAGKS
jgi:hypothetical protein